MTKTKKSLAEKVKLAARVVPPLAPAPLLMTTTTVLRLRPLVKRALCEIWVCRHRCHGHGASKTWRDAQALVAMHIDRTSGHHTIPSASLHHQQLLVWHKMHSVKTSTTWKSWPKNRSK